MRSLRGRLTLGVVAVLAAVLLVSFAAAAREAERSDREALDDRLRRTAELSTASALTAVEQELPERDRRLDEVLSATGSSLRLLLNGRVLFESGRPPPERPSPRPGFRTFTARGRPYRSYTTTLRDEELGGLALLQVTAPLRPLEDRQAALARRLAALGALALLVAGLGTWLAGGLVLRPLRRLQAETAQIAVEADLDRRVPADRGPGELRALAASFNAMLARLGRSAADRERANAATRRFTADAGHELRTPLTSVLTTLSMLARHPELPAERRTALAEDAVAENRRLVALLDGLQALARGDTEGPPHEDVDLAELAPVAVAAAADRHPQAAVTADVPEAPVVVRGWEPGLRLVLDNLLENAARHGGGRVHLTLAPDATVCVDDDGPGIPEDQRGRVFEPFARVDGTGAPGSGLGLALVAQQVRRHGGRVTIGDGALGGARVTVTLPR